MEIPSESRLPQTEDDWEEWRNVITNLYMVENKTCQAVIETMLTDHDFAATEKQYKSHFRRWGLVKNFKPHLARQVVNGRVPSTSLMRTTDPQILKTRAERSLKRYNARKRISNNQDTEQDDNGRKKASISQRPLHSSTTEPSQSTNSAIVPRTAVLPLSISPSMATPSIKSVELLLFKLRDYTHEACIYGHWNPESSSKNSDGRKASRMLSLDLTAGSKYFEERKFPQAQRLWRRALDRVSNPHLLMTWYYETPIALLFELGRLVHNGHGDLAAQLVQAIIKHAKMYLTERDPRFALFMAFENLEIDQLRDAYERAAHSLREGLETRVEKHNPLLYQIRLHRALDLVWFDPKTDLTKWVPPIEDVDRALGPDSALSVYFLMLEAYRLVAAKSYAQAEEVCLQVSRRIDVLKQNGKIEPMKIGMAYRRLGRQYYEQERHADARRILNLALMYIDKSKQSVLVEIYQNQEHLAALANDAADVELWRGKLQHMEANFADQEPDEIPPTPLGSFDDTMMRNNGSMSDAWPSPINTFVPNNFFQSMQTMNQTRVPTGYVPTSSFTHTSAGPSAFLDYDGTRPRFTNDPESIHDPMYGVQLDSVAMENMSFPSMMHTHTGSVISPTMVNSPVWELPDDHNASTQVWPT